MREDIIILCAIGWTWTLIAGVFLIVRLRGQK